MSDRGAAFPIIQAMEDDVADLERWAAVLIGLGVGEHDVSHEAVSVIGWTMMRLGKRIDTQWKAAFAAAGGHP